MADAIEGLKTVEMADAIEGLKTVEMARNRRLFGLNIFLNILTTRQLSWKY
jgi:hypothetical protein